MDTIKFFDIISDSTGRAVSIGWVLPTWRYWLALIFLSFLWYGFLQMIWQAYKKDWGEA